MKKMKFQYCSNLIFWKSRNFLERLFQVIILNLFPIFLCAQTITGTVTDKTGEAVTGANVYIEDSFDGASTNERGVFSFHSNLTGVRTLAVSSIGYETYRTEINLNDHNTPLLIKLRESATEMNAITISAGAFDITDTQRAAVLQPYDVATTPGAMADVTGALNALPGNNSVGEDGRLFVRGGEGYETKAFIDGMLINNFYGTSPEGLATRGRFSPFLFKGQYFSSGGYSAEYGDALSSVLALNSIDMPVRTQTDLALMSVGTAVSHTRKWENRAVFGELGYSNMQPYYSLVKQNVEWKDAPSTLSATLHFKEKLKNGIFKVYYQGSSDHLSLNYYSPDKITELTRVKIDNRFQYLNTNIKNVISEKWSYFAGVSFSSNSDEILLDDYEKVVQKTNSTHLKTVFDGAISPKVYIKMGGEANVESDRFNYRNLPSIFIKNLHNLDVAAFVEPEIHFSSELLVRTGLRFDGSRINNYSAVSPRISMAYRTGNSSQLSMAYGMFHQKPQFDFLRFTPNLDHEQSQHMIVNWQRIKNGRVFRIEGYRKNYDKLVKYDFGMNRMPNAQFNGGSGYAQGVDLFWRDRELVRNLEYWVSYSLLDTKRDYQEYPEMAIPTFAASNKLTLVSKYFITKIRSQVGGSYNFQTGRYYTDPNLEGFQNQKTKNYHDVSLNWSLLIKQNFIVHMMANNVLGFDPIFTYEYADTPDENGRFSGMAIKRPAKRFFFIGIFYTISNDKNANQLNNL